MRLSKFRRRWGGHKGFTLIELAVALAISGLIGAGVTMATLQVLDQSTRNNYYNTASRQVQNAVHWMGRDAQMAQTINGTDGFPLADDLTLAWVEWDHSSHQVVYSIDGGALLRNYSVDGGDPAESVVARNINTVSENTSFDVEVTSENVTVATLKITATVGEGSGAVSVTREREIIPRPHL